MDPESGQKNTLRDSIVICSLELEVSPLRSRPYVMRDKMGIWTT